MTHLKHGYTEIAARKDINGILGYQRALLHLLNHIGLMTEFKPENRQIDAVELIDTMQATADELQLILNNSLADITERINATA